MIPTPRVVHIAVSGNDDHPGSEQAPLATLHAARDRLRRQSSSDREVARVVVHEGTYYFAEPLDLTTADSGTAEAPVVFQAAPGARVTLSGGMKLDCNWAPFRDGILRCRLPGVGDGTLDFDQLFVNGRRQVLARFPSRDDSDPEAYSGYVRAAGGIGEEATDPCPDPDADMTYPHQPRRGILYDPETFSAKRWARPEEARIHIYQSHYWGNLHWNIKAIDHNSRRIWFGAGGHQIGAQYSHDPLAVGEGSRFFIENVFEELSAPMEWYLDRREGVLYWIPGRGVDPDTALVEAPRLRTLVDFRGSQRAPVRRIAFEGMRFACTAATYMDSYEIPSLGDWALCRNGAVRLEGTRNCAIRNCWFDAVGGNAIFVNRYNREVDVTGCTFTESGDSAVCLVGEYESTIGTNKPFPYECRVHNNHMHHCGEYGKQIAGVYISRAKRITVSHNRIHHMPRAGICIGDGTWGGHRVEYNHIHDTCRETGDHGPINAWGRERYWSLIHSHFESTPQNQSVAGDVLFDAMEPTRIGHNLFVEHKGWGIDLDDGSSNYEIFNNVCVGVSLKLREGAYRIVHNNIWIHPANPPSFHLPNIDNHDRYFHNITVMRPDAVNVEHDFDFENEVSGNEIYAMSRMPVTGPWFEEIDRNCFFNDLGHFSMRLRGLDGEQRLLALEEWQAHGFDRNSVFGDPLFIDPDNGNYQVRPESPALAVGFKNFEMGDWGLTETFQPWQASEKYDRRVSDFRNEEHKGLP